MQLDTSPFPLERWPLRGGTPCLDFANTEAYRGTGHDMDLIHSYEMLVAWSLAAGVLHPSEAGPLLRAANDAPDAAAALLSRAKELRRAIHVVMRSVAHRAAPPEAALASLNAFLADSQGHGQIVGVEEGYEVRFCPEDDMALPIWRLTDSAARLLLSLERHNVRECAGHECGWLFLDTTKNHSRRWCDSADCGNRSRVRAYARRKREGVQD
jgi:predicted RNA-binding Zn ribbon-like protein